MVNYLEMFNRFAGGADEMATFIDQLDRHILRSDQQRDETVRQNEELQAEIDRLVSESAASAQEKESLLAKLKDLKKSNIGTYAPAATSHIVAGGHGINVGGSGLSFSSGQGITISLQKNCSNCGMPYTSSAGAITVDDGRCESCRHMFGLTINPQRTCSRCRMLYTPNALMVDDGRCESCKNLGFHNFG